MEQLTNDAESVKILEIERAALALWCKGDPSGFLRASWPDVSYFDPFVRTRLDGIAALEELYESLRGKVSADRFEIVSPRIQIAGDTAILSYYFESKSGSRVMSWNCSEVYERRGAEWKIAHTHWSFNSRQPETERGQDG